MFFTRTAWLGQLSIASSSVSTRKKESTPNFSQLLHTKKEVTGRLILLLRWEFAMFERCWGRYRTSIARVQVRDLGVVGGSLGESSNVTERKTHIT